MRRRPLFVLFSLSLIACGDASESDTSADTTDTAIDSNVEDVGTGSDATVDAGSDSGADAAADTSADAGPTAIASCLYQNLFSGNDECKAYTGASWTLETAEADCGAPSPGVQDGAFTAGVGCGFDSELGRCFLASDDGLEYELAFPGDDPDSCQATVTGCEVFGGGTFVPSEVCDGSTTGGGGGEIPPGVFQPPYESCQAPLDGEEAGNGPDGQVCTNVAISGCTEPGRRFADYGDCDVVRTQRPYYPVPARTFERAEDDPRFDDEDYVADTQWLRGEVEASGCVCCHSTELAPLGSSSWYIEDELWLDTVTDTGLALFANLADSTSLGAYPAEDNNGFDRTEGGLPTTDPERLIAFAERELVRRGVSLEEAAEATPFGGPIYSQLIYDPSPCGGGEGVTAEGTVDWGSGNARYVYVLGEDSANPGVPPNLDLPDATLWRLDVDPSAQPVASGVGYGATPDGTAQRFPETGAPAELEVGGTYYLYILQDVGIPLTRCLFEYPAEGR